MSLEDAREVLECANYAGAALRFAAAQQLLAEHFPTPDDDVEAPPPLVMPENTLRPGDDLKDIGPMPERKPAFAMIKTPPPRPKTPPSPSPPPAPTEDARYGAFNIAAPAMPNESKKVEEDREDEEPPQPANGAMNAMRRFRMVKSSSRKQTTAADSGAETNVESSRNRSFRRNVSGSLSKKPAPPDTEVKNVEVEELASPTVDDKPTPSIVPNRTSRRNLFPRSASSKEKENAEAKSSASSKEPKSNDSTSPSLRIRVPRSSSSKRADRPESKHHEVGNDDKSPSGNVQTRSSRLRLPRVSSKQRFNDNEIVTKKPDLASSRAPPEDKPSVGLGETLAARKSKMPRSASKKRTDVSEDGKQEPNSERFGDKQTPGIGRNRSIRRFVLARSSSKKRVNSTHGTETTSSNSNHEDLPSAGLARSRSMMRQFRLSLSSAKKNVGEKEKTAAPVEKTRVEKPPAEKTRVEKQEPEITSTKTPDVMPVEPEESRVVSKEPAVASNEAVKKRGPLEDSPALKRMDSKMPTPSSSTPQVSKNKTATKLKPATDDADADKDGSSKRRFMIAAKRRSTSVVPPEQSASGSSKHVTFQDPKDSQHEREARRTLPPDAERPNLGPRVQRVRNLLAALKLRAKFNKNPPPPTNTRAPKQESETVERRDSTEEPSAKTPVAAQPLRRSRSDKMIVKSQKPVEKSADPTQAVGSLGKDEVDTVSDEPVANGKEKPASEVARKTVPLRVEEPSLAARAKDRAEKPYKPSATSTKKTIVAKVETGSKPTVSKMPVTVDRGTAVIGSAPVSKVTVPARSPSEKFLMAKAVFSDSNDTDLAPSISAPVVRARKESKAMPRTASEKKAKEVKEKPERKEEKTFPRTSSGSKNKEIPRTEKAKSKPLPRETSDKEADNKTSLQAATPDGERKEAKPMPQTPLAAKRKTLKSGTRSLSGSNLKDSTELQRVAAEKEPSLPLSSSSKQSLGVPAALLASVEPEPMRKTATNEEEEISENTRKVHVSTDVRRVRMPGTGKELVVTDMPVESAGPRTRRKKAVKAKRRTFANLPRVDLTIA